MTISLSVSSVSNSPSDRSAQPVQAVSPAAATTAAGPVAAPGAPNPTLRLDPSLGLVVIEFVGKSGSVTSSIPSQQLLHAYQAGTASPPGDLKTAPAAKS